ncbi:hypothetical protein EDD21DRAFT_423255 [Dissophora ornata]|nr:hypothetical protein EDD21DRAFT_423255 [Dissophora ornata]
MPHQQRAEQLINIGRSYTLGGYAPVTSNSGSRNCQRIKSVEVENPNKRQDRLLSLFRKARSQAPFSQLNPTRPSSTDARPTISNMEQVSTSAPQSSARTIVGARVSSGPGVVTADSKQELIQYLRARAEETRLELLALEQLEKDVKSQEDNGKPQGDLLSSTGSWCDQTSPRLPTVQHVGMRFGTLQSTDGPEDAIANQLISPRNLSSDQQSPQRHTRSTNKPFQRVLVAPHAVHSLKSRESLSECSPGAKAGAMSIYPNATSTTIPSPHSAYFSSSPPVSPLSEMEARIAAMMKNTGSDASTAPNKHSQSRQDEGRRQTQVPKNTRKEHNGRIEEDYGDDSLIYSHLNESHEDLRDVTLSEMMHRNLVMLSDDDEMDTSQHFGGQELGQHGSQNDRDDNVNLPDMTSADRTRLFMSKLEQDFDDCAADTAGQGVPSLLAETIPESGFGDMSFMTYASDSAEIPKITTPFITLQEHHQQSMQLPPVVTQKESILEEFLKSFPSLSHSPEAKQPSSNEWEQAPITFAAPAIVASNTSSGRSLSLPTPIITSRERCRQILRQRDNLNNRARNQHHQEAVSRSSRSPSVILETFSPIASSSPLNTAPWSNVPTPLTSFGISCGDTYFEVNTPASIYNSAREEFTLDSFRTDSQESVYENSDTPHTEVRSILADVMDRTPRPKDKLKNTNSATPTTAIAAAPRHRPLDMIIVRPERAAATSPASGESSPWSPLSSSSSAASSYSTNSSWSWSRPSSTWRSRDNSPALSSHSSVELRPRYSQERANRDAGSQLPSTLHDQSHSAFSSNVNIKSRSMSSLIKHQNGWLGFQVLDVRMVATGRYHIVVVTQSNQVFSCWEPNNDGDNHSESLKDTSDNEIEETLGRQTKTMIDADFVQDTTFQPGLVQIQEDMDTLPSKIVKIVCSDSATFLLTENGDLWGWGSFEDASGHRIGLLNQKYVPRPMHICAQRIKDVVCGRNHVLILNFSGDVISWGANEYGQLGRPVSSSATAQEQEQTSRDLSPYFIESLPPCIVGIGAGKLSSFAWDEKRLYGWGDNTFGQLGRATASDVTSRLRHQPQTQHPQNKEDSMSIPREIPLHWKGKSIKQVQGGERHTVLLTFSGLVISFGSDDFGQLGVRSSTPTSASASIASASTSSLGSTSPASIGSSSGGSAWSSLEASPIHSTERSSKPKIRLFPVLVRIGPGVKEIRCGDFHTVTCSDNGQMFTWGRGFDGIVAIHNTRSVDRTVGEADVKIATKAKATAALISTVDMARRVVAVSAMRAGVTIALVSSAEDASA